MDRRLPDWILAYLDFTADHEAPEKIHMWTALAVLSAAVKRQVYLERPFYKLYPNIYALIVAESARARKSVAMSIGMGVLKDADPEVYVMRGRMTPEGLVKSLNRNKTVVSQNGTGSIYQDSHVMVFADELGTLFGYDRSTASRMAMLLTEIYGSPDHYPHTTAGEGVWDLYNLYPVVLAATDPRNLKVLPEEAIAGLLGRLIFVVTNERRQSTAWLVPEQVARAEQIRIALVNDLAIIGQVKGVIKPTKEAKLLFSNWYELLSKKEAGDARAEPFLARCHDTALKVATLVSISRSNSLVMDADHMAMGIALVDKMLPESERALNWTGTTVYAQNRAKFIDLLATHGKTIARRHLIRMLGVSSDDFTSIATTLVQEGTIELKTVGQEIVVCLLSMNGGGP